MNSAHELHAVVVSSNPAVIDSILPCLEELCIASSLYSQPVSALQTFASQRVDALFVDRDTDPELLVIRRMRSSRSSSGAVAFAIVPERKSVPEASRVADFVIDKPLTLVSINRAVRAAYGIMLKERKRYFRHSLQVPIHITDSTYRRFVGQTTNISQTGIALECAAPFATSETVGLEFYLPGKGHRMNCKAQIIWKGDQGKAGLTFTQMNAVDKDCLAAWIEEEFHRLWRMPGVEPAAGSRAASSFII